MIMVGLQPYHIIINLVHGKVNDSLKASCIIYPILTDIRYIMQEVRYDSASLPLLKLVERRYFFFLKGETSVC
jgi:hypothetical protein